MYSILWDFKCASTFRRKIDLHGDILIKFDFNTKEIPDQTYFLHCSTELKDGVEFELVGDLDKLNTVCYKPEDEENGHKNGKNGGKEILNN